MPSNLRRYQSAGKCVYQIVSACITSTHRVYCIQSGGPKIHEPNKGANAKSKAKFCLCCCKDFTLRRRRHTCKCCNNIVCKKCSLRRLEMQAKGNEEPNKRMRICDVCLDEVKHKRVDVHIRPISYEVRRRVCRWAQICGELTHRRVLISDKWRTGRRLDVVGWRSPSNEDSVIGSTSLVGQSSVAYVCPQRLR